MKGNIVQFLEDAKSGKVPCISFLEAISQFERSIAREPDPSNLRPADHVQSDEAQRTQPRYEDILGVAVESFVCLTQKTTEKEISPLVFLGTDISYENKAGKFLDGPQTALLLGLESLTQIYARSPTLAPLQRWANIAVASNFLPIPPKDGEKSSLSQAPNDFFSSIPSNPGQEVTHDDGSSPNSPEVALLQHQRELAQLWTGKRTSPLGFMVEQYHGVRRDCMEDEQMPGYRRALCNWNLFLSNFALDENRHRDFRATLSQSQLTSARLLLEWWMEDIDLDMKARRAFQAIVNASYTGRLDHNAFSLFGISAPAPHEQKREHYLQQLIFDFSGPPYHALMFRLFQMEFLPCHYFNVTSRQVLIKEREAAVKLAACQRISLHCYKSLLKECGFSFQKKDEENEKNYTNMNIEEESSMVNSEVVSSPSLLLQRPSHVETAEHHAAGTLGTGLSHFAKKDLSKKEVERIERAILPEPGLRIAATLHPCAWLDDVDPLMDLPYYLWDVKRRQRIITCELGESIEYTAVSHTWGRYQYEDTTNFPPVYLDGVQGWGIPQNSKFKVEELPNILALIPFDTSYVWFDLVCIPQRPTEKRLIQISEREIGRQAKIFRRAKFAVAWFNDIDDWKGVNAAIRRLSLHFLQQGRDTEMPRSVLDLAAPHSETALELFADNTDASDGPEDLMNRWFSSLWTLQEVCLRPDMRLCNKRWEVLVVGESGEVRIGMDDLVALAEGGIFQANNWNVVQAVGAVHQGSVTTRNSELVAPGRIDVASESVKQLWELLDLTGLEHLLNASRCTILTLGNQRYCRANRANAIMSAVGVTDWFTSRETEHADGENSTNASEYPLAFVREAASKLGAEFYGSNLAEGELLEMLVLSLKPPGARRSGAGSMVPFSSSPLSRTPSLTLGFTGTDHPAVSTWNVLPDMSVEIRSAGIVSFTGQPRSGNRRLNCSIAGPEIREPVSLLVKRNAQEDLDSWVDSFLPNTRNFAVSLHHGPGESDGILLKELSSGDLIKVGTYHLTGPDARRDAVPETHQVNWRVL